MTTKDNPLASMFSPPKEHDVTGMLLEKYLPQAIRAHHGTSFSPEIRGKSYVKEYSELLAADLLHVEKFEGDAVTYQAKFERLFLAWMASKGNCISTMITGGSNFPVRRAEKANNSERKRSEELHEWRKKALAAIERNHKKANTEEIDPITEARNKVTQERTNLEAMKAVNKIIRSKKTDAEKLAEIVAVGFTPSNAEKILTPDRVYGTGFQTFQLTNCRARLKNMEARLQELERRATTEAREVERGDGIKVVENAAENRLQVFFPGKPDDATRAKLKSSGFRWAPSNGCWQSYLNTNAKSKLTQILQ